MRRNSSWRSSSRSTRSARVFDSGHRWFKAKFDPVGIAASIEARGLPQSRCCVPAPAFSPAQLNGKQKDFALGLAAGRRSRPALPPQRSSGRKARSASRTRVSALPLARGRTPLGRSPESAPPARIPANGRCPPSSPRRRRRRRHVARRLRGSGAWRLSLEVPSHVPPVTVGLGWRAPAALRLAVRPSVARCTRPTGALPRTRPGGHHRHGQAQPLADTIAHATVLTREDIERFTRAGAGPADAARARGRPAARAQRRARRGDDLFLRGAPASQWCCC